MVGQRALSAKVREDERQGARVIVVVDIVSDQDAENGRPVLGGRELLVAGGWGIVDAAHGDDDGGDVGRGALRIGCLVGEALRGGLALGQFLEPRAGVVAEGAVAIVGERALRRQSQDREGELALVGRVGIGGAEGRVDRRAILGGGKREVFGARRAVARGTGITTGDLLRGVRFGRAAQRNWSLARRDLGGTEHASGGDRPLRVGIRERFEDAVAAKVIAGGRTAEAGRGREHCLQPGRGDDQRQVDLAAVFGEDRDVLAQVRGDVVLQDVGACAGADREVAAAVEAREQALWVERQGNGVARHHRQHADHLGLRRLRRGPLFLTCLAQSLQVRHAISGREPWPPNRRLEPAPREEPESSRDVQSNTEGEYNLRASYCAVVHAVRSQCYQRWRARFKVR